MNLQRLITAVVLTLVAAPAWSAAESTCRKSATIPGDYPDPSVIRVGKNYFATATTSDWAPVFPILQSSDLQNWKTIGSVFDDPPSWTSGQHWAPEIVSHEGEYYVYYTARKKDGPLCVAVAKAKSPQGPYQDYGPLVCEEVGSIDGVPFTDEHGERFLIWKEDGNSVGRPTPLWIQKLSNGGTKLIGEKKELLRNDTAWEGHLVEGPFIVRREGFFYLFYSANACCGKDCNYAMGVARARSLHGPYQKYAGNPILKGNSAWKCPGHGSLVRGSDGHDYLLHHAYGSSDSVYVGRQALLAKVKWREDGWPTINDGQGPIGHPRTNPQAQVEYSDEFEASAVAGTWQWPQSNRPLVSIRKGILSLKGKEESEDDLLAGVIAQSPRGLNYQAKADVVASGGTVGLSAYGNSMNAIGVSVVDETIQLWKRQDGKTAVLDQKPLASASKLTLRMVSTAGFLYSFSYSLDGQSWKSIGPALEAQYLPPWDLGVRVALTAGHEEPALIDRIAIDPL